MKSNRSYLRKALLVTLTLFFGLQSFRVFLPEVSWYLGEQLSAEMKALFALGVFLTALLMPLIRKLLGERGMLLLTAGGMALTYLGFQFADSALAYLILATIGIVMWGWFVPFWLTSPRNRMDGKAIPVLAVGLPLAFLLDTVLRALLLGYDLGWRHDWISLLISTLAVLGTLVLLWFEVRDWLGDAAPQEPGWGGALPFLGLGPFLFLAMSTAHNTAAFTLASGMDDLRGAEMTILFAALGAVSCVIAASMSATRRWLAALVNGVILVASLAWIFINIGSAWLLAVAAWPVAAVTLWAALGFLLSGIARRIGSMFGSWRITLANFLALLLMLAILFMVMQFKLDWISIVAGILLALTSIWATGFGRQDARFTNPFPQKLVSIPAALGLLVILVWAMLLKPVSAVSVGSPGAPLRVMTYNIHQGINANLMVDLESIADAIASENPDVVALNEVNRARATNGFLDVLPYLSRRLDMPYVFGANYQDGQYGNAILSRYPILDWENTHYVNNTTEIRGALRVVIQSPDGEVTFYSTHLDHISGEDNARLEQVTELLALWGGAGRTIILGDLNAVPDTPEISALYAAGFVDALLVTGNQDAFTFWDPIPTPGRRIDYIFLTPDMSVGNAWVPQTRASDHLPVVAEINP